MRRRYNRKQRRRTGRPVVVLTMGKSGSTALSATIEKYLPERPAYKVHRLAQSTLAEAEGSYRGSGTWPPHPHIFESHYLRTALPTETEPWDVVCTIREPVGRSVAAYFQTAQRLGNPMDDPDAAVRTMLGMPEFWLSGTWFDTEVRDVLGVDVFDHPFDPDIGHRRIDAPGIRLLILRQEQMDRSATVLSEFLGIRISQLVRTNVGADKSYADAYRQFKTTAKLPAFALDALCDGAFARHFYSASERCAFRGRWE